MHRLLNRRKASELMASGVTVLDPARTEIAADVAVGRDTVTIRQVDAPKPVQAEDWTGTRVPLHAGCAGLVVMATWPAKWNITSGFKRPTISETCGVCRTSC